MGIIIVLIGIVTVVGRYHRDIVFLCVQDQGVIDLLLFLDIMSLELDKIVFAEEVEPPFEFFFCFFFAFVENGLGDIGSNTAGGGDESFVVFKDKLLVDAGIF